MKISTNGMNLPTSIRNLADEIEGLPGIGPRQAIRIAIHLSAQNPEKLRLLTAAISGVLKARSCPICFHIHDSEKDICEICLDSKRDTMLIAIVEKETDLISMESSRKFSGRYLIIGSGKKAGTLEEWQRARLDALKERIRNYGEPPEIIIAMNHTTYGDITATIISNEIEPYARKLSRLGRGIPFGGEIEFADADTIGAAIDNRG